MSDVQEALDTLARIAARNTQVPTRLFANIVRAHIDALTAEVERLRDGLNTAVDALRIANARAEAAEAKLAAAEADARRLSWLEQLLLSEATVGGYALTVGGVEIGIHHSSVDVAAQTLRAAIDTARSQS